MTAAQAASGPYEPAAHDLRSVGARVDALLEELAEKADPAVVDRAEELVRLLVELYGEGLARIVAALDREPPAGPAPGEPRDLLRRLCDDDLVAALLIVHDLHPDDVETRVVRALDGVRPYLGTHAGDVDLVGIDPDGVVRLALRGTCDGCPSSALTAQTAIESSVLAAAPEVTRVEVAGVAGPAETEGQPGLLQIQPFRPAREAPGPCPVPP